MTKIHLPVVAGLFYPGNEAALRGMITDLLSHADFDRPMPKAIISPHAGYVYSGAIAASAYAPLSKSDNQIKRVVVLGPAHHYAISGMAVHSAESFVTPLGDIPIDRNAINQLLSLPQVNEINEAFQEEHSIEVQLPFLQMTLQDFSLIPILVGFATDEQVAEVLETLWNGPSTLIVISSDLSHYMHYDDARKIDRETTQTILDYQKDSLNPEQACGGTAIRGLLQVAKKKQLNVRLLDLRNSGDTSGQKDHVVGYAAFHFTE